MALSFKTRRLSSRRKVFTNDLYFNFTFFFFSTRANFFIFISYETRTRRIFYGSFHLEIQFVWVINFKGDLFFYASILTYHVKNQFFESITWNWTCYIYFQLICVFGTLIDTSIVEKVKQLDIEIFALRRSVVRCTDDVSSFKFQTMKKVWIYKKNVS